MHLAIDTTTATAGVAAISLDGTIEAELTWRAERNHTAELYSAIEEVLRRARTTKGDLTGTIVATGPGSFTGIRIGMATAKGLAIALDIPLVGIGTLAAATYAFAWRDRTVWGVLDAGRGQVVAAAFRDSEAIGLSAEARWQQVVAEQILSPEELCTAIANNGDRLGILCGELPTGVNELIRAKLADDVMIPSHSAMIRRPGHLARLGWRRLIDGDTDDLMTLAPVYARPPAALERKT